LGAGNTNEAYFSGLRLLGRAAAKFELPRTSWSRPNLGKFFLRFFFELQNSSKTPDLDNLVILNLFTIRDFLQIAAPQFFQIM